MMCLVHAPSVFAFRLGPRAAFQDQTAFAQTTTSLCAAKMARLIQIAARLPVLMCQLTTKVSVSTVALALAVTLMVAIRACARQMMCLVHAPSVFAFRLGPRAAFQIQTVPAQNTSSLCGKDG